MEEYTFHDPNALPVPTAPHPIRSPSVSRSKENLQEMSETEYTTCIALYDYAPRHMHDIALREGRTVKVVEKCDEEGSTEWWKVRNDDGTEGYVPATYLFVVPPAGPTPPVPVDEQAVDKDLMCAACRHLLSHALVHVPCGCHVCTRCLWQRDGVCPECMQTVRWAKETQDAPAELLQRIGQVEVRCPDCNEPMKLMQLPQHRERQCVIACPEGCEFSSSRQQMDMHLQADCPFAPVSCAARDVGCPARVPRNQLDAHVQRCAFVALHPTLSGHQDQIYSLNTQMQVLTARIEEVVQRISRLETIAEAGVAAAKDAEDKKKQARRRRTHNAAVVANVDGETHAGNFNVNLLSQ